MEKQTVQIQKIKDGMILNRDDEVAVEHQLTITLRNGERILVTCTPAYLEELVLGRRFLERDMTEEELSCKEDVDKSADSLKAVDLNEIFSIAKDSFENPGQLFTDTGCAHSCALVHEGLAVCCIEDVGRHNALDKVIGYALKNKIPFSNSYIFASGRIAGDYLQKAVDAGFPMVVSRAAVTSSAVALAKEKDITLLGFIRKNTGNIYHEGKVKLNG